MSNEIHIKLKSTNNCLKFNDYSLDERDKILSLGMLAWNVGITEAAGWNNSQWKEKLNENNKKHTQQIEEMNNAINKHEKNQQQTIQKYENNMVVMREEIKNQMKIRFEEQIEYWKNKFTTTEIEINKKTEEITEISNQYEEKLNKKTEQSKKECQEIFNQLNTERDIREEKIDFVRKELQTKIDALEEDKNRKIVQNNNSALKGQEGENFFKCELTKRFPSYEIVDTHSEGHCGDIHLISDGRRGLFEIKNYKNNVLKTERDKFLSNIKTNTVDWGILLSCGGVAGRKDFAIDIVEGKPAIYLFDIKNNLGNINIAVNIVEMICESGIDLTNKEKIDGLTNFSKKIKRLMTSFKKKINNHHKSMIDIMNDQEMLIKDVFGLLKLKY